MQQNKTTNWSVARFHNHRPEKNEKTKKNYNLSSRKGKVTHINTLK